MIVEGGFPHSEISGSKPVRDSPNLIAAYHVLHRLSAPRHPPNALKTLDRYHYQCPPLGRGSNHKGWNGIDKKLVILLANVSNIHAVRPGCLAAINSKDYSSKSSPNTFFFTMSNKPYLQCGNTNSVVDEPGAKWWSQTGSNRRPHACKARALPAELWPQLGRRNTWWAWEDLNFRPHAYQARALTN